MVTEAKDLACLKLLLLKFNQTSARVLISSRCSKSK